MSTLTQIRAAIKTTLAANLSGITVHSTVPGGVTGVAVVVLPATADFTVAMGRGTDTWEFDLRVLASAADLDLGQQQLDPYLTGAGASSIRQVIFTNRTLGLADTTAHIAGMSAYGLEEVGGIQHVSATLRLVAHTSGGA